MWTPEFQAFVSPARKRPQIWRVFLGVVLAGLIYVATFFAILAIVLAVTGLDGLGTWLNELGQTPSSLLALLGTFAGMALGAFAAAWLLHNRPAWTLFGTGLLRGMALGCVVTLIVFLATLPILPTPFEISRATPNDVFLMFLAPALIAILIQTGAEELLFRGYLQQQFAARFHSPWVWMVIPSLMFGALHWDPTSAGGNAWLVIAATTLFGLVAADLTRVTGNIGAAWGFHFVNNCVAMLVIAVEGPLSGLSYWRLEAQIAEIPPLIIAQDMLITVIIWVLMRLWLARRGTGEGP